MLDYYASIRHFIFFLLFFLLASCSEFGEHPGSESSEYPTPGQLQQAGKQAPDRITFQTIDTERFWEWVDPDIQSDRLIAEADDRNDIEALIELMYAVEKRVSEGDQVLEDEELREFSFLTHTYLSTLYSKYSKKFGFNEEEEYREQAISKKKQSTSRIA